MKILHVISNLNAGGAEMFVVMLATEQKKLGNDVSILVTDRFTNSTFECNLIQKLQLHSVRLYNANRKPGRNFSIVYCLWNIIKVLNSTRPDIVNSHLPFAHLLTAFCLYPSAIKLKRHILTIHNGPEIWSNLNLIFNRSKASIYCSKASFDSCIKRDCNYLVIENGIAKPEINMHMVDTEMKSVIGNKKMVLCVGRLSKQKNYDLLVKIAKRFADDNVAFVVAGILCDSTREDLENFKPLNNIFYVGTLIPEQIYYLMQECDCFLNTSHYEGLPITVLEAFFTGCPCLLSPIAPHIEIGSTMPYCYIPSKFDLDSFAEKLNYILSETNDKNDIFRKRSDSLKKFRIEKTASTYIKFYNELQNSGISCLSRQTSPNIGADKREAIAEERP